MGSAVVQSWQVALGLVEEFSSWLLADFDAWQKLRSASSGCEGRLPHQCWVLLGASATWDFLCCQHKTDETVRINVLVLCCDWFRRKQHRQD